MEYVREEGRCIGYTSCLKKGEILLFSLPDWFDILKLCFEVLRSCFEVLRSCFEVLRLCFEVLRCVKIIIFEFDFFILIILSTSISH